MVAHLIRALVLVGLIGAHEAGALNVLLLCFITFGLGVAETIADTAAQALPPQLVPAERLPPANARLFATETATNTFVGPPIAGLLASFAVTAAIGVPCVLYLLAAGSVSRIPGPLRADGGPHGSIRSDIFAGIRYLARHRLLRSMTVMIAVSNLASSAMTAVLPVFLLEESRLHLTSVEYGVLLSVAAIGAVTGSLMTTRVHRQIGRAGALLLAVALSAIWFSSPGWAPTYPILLAAFLVGGMSAGIWNVTSVSLRQEVVPAHILGRTIASIRLLAWWTQPLGALVAGLAAGVVRFEVIFLTAGVVATLQLIAAPVIIRHTLEAAIEAA